MDLCNDFCQGKLPINSLNFWTIIMLPKCKEAIKKYIAIQTYLFVEC
jgi:hypothetical protein